MQQCYLELFQNYFNVIYRSRFKQWFIYLLLQKFCRIYFILKTFLVKFGLSLHSKSFNLKHNTVPSMFQKKSCYNDTRLGVIHFECIAIVARHGTFGGSTIYQSTKVVLMYEWTNDKWTPYAVRMQKKITKLLLIFFIFIVCN